MNIGELIFSLGFKSVGSDVQKNFQKSVKSFSQIESNSNKTRAEGIKVTEGLSTKMATFGKVLGGVAAGVTAAASALLYFVKNAADAAVQVDKMQSLTGLSTDKIQQLGAMAAQTGMNVNDLIGTIQHLQQESVNIKLGQGGDMGAYNYLKIDPHSDPLKILDQVKDKLKTMPMAEGINMAKRLGLSDEVIYFLKNVDSLEPISKSMIPNESEIKRLKQFSFQFNKLFHQSKIKMQKFGAALLPLASSILNAIEKISVYLTPAIRHVVSFVESIGSVFSAVTKKIGKFSADIKPYLLPLILIGVALFAAFMPVTAAFTILGAVLEDLWKFVNGKDSLFGRMFNWLTDINSRIKDLIHFYIQLRKAMTLGNHDEYYDNMEKEMLTGADEWLKNKQEEQKSPEHKAKKEQIDSAINKQMKGINLDPSIGKTLDILKNKIFNPLLDNEVKAPITPQPRIEGNKTSSVNNNINININESKNPQQTANVLQTKLSDAFWQRQGGLA